MSASAAKAEGGSSRLERWGKYLGIVGGVLSLAGVVFAVASAYHSIRSDLHQIQENMATKADVRDVRNSVTALALVLDDLIDELAAKKAIGNAAILKKHLPKLGAFDQGGRKVLVAVAGSEPRRDGVDIVYAVNRPSPVTAGFDGMIDSVEGAANQLTLRIKSNAEVLVYAGMSGLAVRQGQQVLAGDTLGTIEPGVHNPDTARLRVTYLRDRRPVPAPDNIAPLYTSAGQRAFAVKCAGCHSADIGGAGQYLVRNGRLVKSGIAATEENIVAKLRAGGQGMPRFGEDTLPESDARGIAAFLRSLPAPSGRSSPAVAMAVPAE